MLWDPSSPGSFSSLRSVSTSNVYVSALPAATKPIYNKAKSQPPSSNRFPASVVWASRRFSSSRTPTVSLGSTPKSVYNTQPPLRRPRTSYLVIAYIYDTQRPYRHYYQENLHTAHGFCSHQYTFSFMSIICFLDNP